MVERQGKANHEDVEMEKERVPKEDGRYIIFYSFGDEETQESEDG
jgi:hypothetical protein